MTLNASAAPSANFALSEWKLQLPVDAEGGFVGRYTEIKDLDGYTGDYFFTGPDGAMVLSAPVEGVTTGGSKYARSELRELKGNTEKPENAAWTLEQGGAMAVAMQVDEVPTKFDGTGARIVIGQIHGGDFQLVRLYYENGSIYWVNGRNEAQAKDVVYQFKDAQGNTPKVSLNETFSYTMEVKGHDLRLSLQADGKTYTSSITVGPGWDDNQFYFKAGLYLGTNEDTSRGDGQVSLYGIDVTHDGSKPVLHLPDGGATPPSAPVKPAPIDLPPITNPTPSPVPETVISDLGVKARLDGTSGDDRFAVGHKSTTVVAGDGHDTVRASVSWTMSTGVERLELAGSEAINGTGGQANDTIIGNDAANTLKGDSGADYLSGGGGSDCLKGGSGDDELHGGADSDVLTGDSGTDKLFGGAGSDQLAGGSDSDILTGGEGADVFVFTSLSHSRAGQSDILMDFVSGQDDIDLRLLDANTKLGGDQAFGWSGSGIGQLVLRDGHLVADVNGDGRMDLDLDLRSATIMASDILL